MATPNPRYWAFISYSHRDKAWADWLHKALETYRVPRRLLGKPGRDGPLPKRLYPVFRDREELPSSADLSNNINESLGQSRYLIVICSPSAAVSRWVNEEIIAFKKMGRADRILALVVDGEPNASDRPDSGELECFPPALRHRVDEAGQLRPERVEPIAADARTGQDGKANARLKLLAGLLGVPYDELRQRERRRRRRRLATVAAILLTCTVTASVLLRWEQRHATLLSDAEQGRQALLHGDPGVAALYLGQAYAAGLQTPAVRLMLADAMRYVSQPLHVVHLTDAESVRDISQDGRLMATAALPILNRDKTVTVRVWDLLHYRQLYASAVDSHDRQDPSSVHFSPDGRYLAVALQDGRIEILDAVDGKRLRMLRETPGPHLQVRFSPDSRHLLSLSGAPQASLWDVMTGRRTSLAGDGANLSLPKFSRDGRYILNVDRAGIARVWDLHLGRAAFSLRAQGAGIAYTWFTDDDRRIVTLDQDNDFDTWDARTGAHLTRTTGSRRNIQRINVDRDGMRILIEDQDHFVTTRLIDEVSAVQLNSPSEVYAAYLSPDGDKAVTTSQDGRVRLWNAVDGVPLAEMPQRQGSLENFYDARFTPDSRRVVLTSLGHNLSGSNILIWDLGAYPMLFGDVAGGLDSAQPAFSRDGRYLMTLGLDGSVHLSDVRDGHLIGRFDHGLDEDDAGYLSTDGAQLVTVNENKGEVSLWETATGKRLGHWHPADAIASATLSPDGRRLYLSDDYEKACLIELPSGTACHPIGKLEGYSLLFTPDGQHFLTCGSHIQIWDAAQGRLRESLGVPGKNGSRDCALSADGTRLIAITSDGYVQSLDVATGRVTDSFRLPLSDYDDMSVDATRNRLALTQGGNVEIWDVPGHRLLHLLENQGDAHFAGAQFSRDGQFVLTVGNGGQVGLYDADDGRHLTQLGSSGGDYNNELILSPDGRLLAVPARNVTVLWDIAGESRPPAEIAAWLRCRVPWSLADGKLTAATPDPRACPAQ